MIGTHEIHPAAEIFPLLEGKAFDELCADIKAHGLRSPIVRVWVGHDAAIGTRKPLILDGRNRLRACLKLGITLRFDDDLVKDDDHVAYVLSANLHRRHMNESQRAMVAAKIATLPRGSNQHRTNVLCTVPTQSAASKMLNVSDRTVRRAKQVIDAATPETVERVERGEISIGEAARITAERPVEAKPVIKPRSRKSAATGARDRMRQRVDAMDEQVAELVGAGLGVVEIADKLELPRNTVQSAKRRLKLTRGTLKGDNPLANLISCADEFHDTWELALSNNKSLQTASAEQRAELVERLDALVRVTRKLIARLNKEAKESETAA